MTQEEFEVERLTNTVRGAVDYWKSGPAMAALGELRQRAMDGVKMAGQVEAISDLTRKVNELYSLFGPIIQRRSQGADDAARAEVWRSFAYLTGVHDGYQEAASQAKCHVNPYAAATPRREAYERAKREIAAHLDECAVRERRIL